MPNVVSTKALWHQGHANNPFTLAATLPVRGLEVDVSAFAICEVRQDDHLDPCCVHNRPLAAWAGAVVPAPAAIIKGLGIAAWAGAVVPAPAAIIKVFGFALARDLIRFKALDLSQRRAHVDDEQDCRKSMQNSLQ